MNGERTLYMLVGLPYSGKSSWGRTNGAPIVCPDEIRLHAHGGERDSGIYAHDDQQLATAVRRYALAHGNNKKLRIALCGYEGEHKMPKSWTCLAWKANGGHGNAAQGRGRANAGRERIWFSPHCLAAREPELFERV